MTPRICQTFGPALGVAILSLSGPANAQDAQAITVPSGQTLTLTEVLLDNAPGALWARFRFVAPGIAREIGRVSSDEAGLDMDHLCGELALPYLDYHRIEPARVVISLSDRSVPFGEKNSAATQFFETYRPENGVCIWEEF